MVKHTFVKFELGKDYASLMGQSVYYNNGLASYAGYQAVLVEHMYWFEQLELSDHPVLVDAGANVGYVSMAFSNNFDNSSVYALEPAQRIYKVLKKNVSGFKNIKPFCLGLGNSNNKVDLYVDKKESAFSSVKHILSNEFDTEKIQIKTLDMFCQEQKIEKIDILKIDVEGYELEVLTGAKNTLKKVKYLHIEANTKDYLFSDLCRTISACGVNYNLKFIRNFSNVSDSLFRDGDILFEIFG